MDKGEHTPSETDRLTVEVWLGQVKSEHTRRNYRRYARQFIAFLGKPLMEVTAVDARAFLDSLHEVVPSSHATITGAVKSLLVFAYETGALTNNPGQTIRTRKIRQSLARRILDERDVTKMLLFETDQRNYALLMVAYSGGLLISELAKLRWCEVADRGDGSAVLTIAGVGKKTRQVQISAAAWTAVSILRGHAGPCDPVFLSKKGGHLHPSAVHRVVKAAAARVGLPEKMSTYWLRHSHASHSLDRGVPIQVVQARLGHSDRDTTQRYAKLFTAAAEAPSVRAPGSVSRKVMGSRNNPVVTG